jgi:glycosyltransferase involved in cell wall biosynthesis
MRIGICTGRFQPAAGGGFSLVNTIIKEISESNKNHQFILFSREPAKQRVYIENGITYVSSWNNHRDFNTIVESHNVDLLWLLGPFNMNLTVPYIFPIWDLGHRVLPYFPEMQPWQAREDLYQKMLYKATYIIVGNETGKKELLENYSVNQNKIRIVPFPISDFCNENIEIPQSLSYIKSPFIFYPAQFWAHKNHIAILEALCYLRDVKNLLVNCYFTGSDYGNLQYIQNKINELKLENQVSILGFVDLPVLRFLYKKALALVYVSVLGPNNLPPLEAAALGCPIILSDIPGHVEQMKDIPIFVNATQPEQIGNAILDLHKNPAKRQNMIDKGLAFAKGMESYSYVNEVSKIFDEFAGYRKMWD